MPRPPAYETGGGSGPVRHLLLPWELAGRDLTKKLDQRNVTGKTP